MTRHEIEAQGAAMLERHGLDGWLVRVAYEADDFGDEDDIRGRYGRCFMEDKLIWVNARYADDPALVEEILRHEIAHALLDSNDHGDEHKATMESLR